jgi:hypothetical protein
LFGKPTVKGIYNFTVKLTDDNGLAGTYTDSQTYTINIASITSDSFKKKTSAPKSTTATNPTGDNSIILNNFPEFTDQEGLGKSLILNSGDVIYFCLVDSANCLVSSSDVHTITLKNIDQTDNSAVLTFASTPFDVVFYQNQPKDIDIDQDGSNDLQVTLNSLTATTANFTFKKLVKAASTSSNVPIQQEVTTTSNPSKGSSNLGWLMLGGGLMLGALILGLYLRNRLYKRIITG